MKDITFGNGLIRLGDWIDYHWCFPTFIDISGGSIDLCYQQQRKQYVLSLGCGKCSAS